MAYQHYAPPSDLLIGYDPNRDLDNNHLVRLLERIAEESITIEQHPVQRGREPYHPKLLVKVLVYAYATGLRSSRQIERQCAESLPFLFLTRGAAPSYRTLCFARSKYASQIEECWIALLLVAQAAGLKRVGRIDVDSTKIRADVSPESIIKCEDMERFRQVLSAILEEAQSQDDHEDAEGYAGQTVLDQPVGTDQMREVIRKIRESARNNKDTSVLSPKKLLSVPKNLLLGRRMLPRLKNAVSALEKAIEAGQKHVSLTDPDAQMMGEGRNKKVQECHSLDIAVDNGLLVSVQTSQFASDNIKLPGLVEDAQAREPDGVSEVVADCGFYQGDTLLALEKQGIKTCVPEPWTARDLRKGLSAGTTRNDRLNKVSFVYDEQTDCYRCPQDNVLRFTKTQQSAEQLFRIYVAEQQCSACPLKEKCLQNKKATKRMLRVGDRSSEINSILERFSSEEHQKKYHERGKNVETVFAFVRTTLKVSRWMLRGADKVKSEAKLIAAAYQLRKVHTALKASRT